MRIYLIGASAVPLDRTAAELAALGHLVTVYLPGGPFDIGAWEQDGFRVVRLPFHGLWSSIYAVFQPVDIIHYHDHVSAIWSFLPRFFHERAHVIASIHPRQTEDGRHSLVQALAEWAQVRFPHVTIVGSPALQAYCRSMYGTDPLCLPEDVHAVHDHRTSVEAFNLTENGYLLCAGGWTANNGFDQAIEAYASVKTSVPLVIAGREGAPSAYRTKLEKLATKDRRVKLIPWPGEDAMRALVANCYAFIAPTRVPGLSTRTLQAMAAGKVVIHPDLDHHHAYTKGQAITYANKREFTEAIRWALKDPSLAKRRGKRAEREARKTYDPSVHGKQLEQLYASMDV